MQLTTKDKTEKHSLQQVKERIPTEARYSAISEEQFRKKVFEVCPTYKVDSENKEILNSLFFYVNGHTDKQLDPQKGIWLWGNIGTGKSTIILILGEVLRLQGRGYKTINCSNIASEYAAHGIDALNESTYNEVSGIVKPVNRAFDELGREPLPAKHYGNELNVMQYIFQIRYEFKNKVRTFVTTNLMPEAIEVLYGKYIADRVKEMFNVIELKGGSRR